MSAYSRIAEHILAPTVDLARGTSAMRAYAELRRSQWWPRERILELQTYRLLRLIAYCHAQVPYYRRVMSEGGIDPGRITSVESLARMPVTTKELVRAETDAFVAEGFPRGRLVRGRTGGSTGTPLEFFSTRETRSSHGSARALRAREWAGLRFGDPIVYVTKSRPPESRRAAVSHALRRRVERSTFIDAAQISDETLPYAVRKIERAQCPALLGYASSIYLVAAYIREEGLTAPAVAAVIYGGEPLHGFQKNTIREVFNIEPLSKYSSFENYEIAMECPTHAGLHVAAEDLIVEIVDEAGSPLPAGVNGRILVTDLHNYGMPLLRYDTGDVGALIERPCDCGRGLPLLSLALTRSGDIIYTPSGKRLSPLALGVSALAGLAIRQCQFVQDRLDHVVIRVVPSRDVDNGKGTALKAGVASLLKPILGEDVEIEVIITNRIEPTAAGKHRFIISEIDPGALDGRRPRETD